MQTWLESLWLPRRGLLSAVGDAAQQAQSFTREKHNGADFLPFCSDCCALVPGPSAACATGVCVLPKPLLLC